MQNQKVVDEVDHLGFIELRGEFVETVRWEHDQGTAMLIESTCKSDRVHNEKSCTGFHFTSVKQHNKRHVEVSIVPGKRTAPEFKTWSAGRGGDETGPRRSTGF
jgi:hypothetical protein